MKKKYWFLIVLLAALGLVRLYYKITDDFRLGNITFDVPYHVEWDVPEPAEKEKNLVQSILKEKFNYIGKGSQSYAFGSDNDRYIIKFFKFKHLAPNWFVEMFPPITPFKEYRTKQSMRKNRKLYGLFNGYNLAYKEHKKESGLIFIHLNKSKNKFGEITVFDKLGIPRNIDLDSVAFILQEKAQTTRAAINEALESNNISVAKHKIDQIFNLYRNEYEKGIYDKDHGVMHNTGFVYDTPIHLDVGKLIKYEGIKRPEAWQEDLAHIAWKFKEWIKENHPSYEQEFTTFMEQELKEKTGKPFEFSQSIPPPKIRI